MGLLALTPCWALSPSAPCSRKQGRSAWLRDVPHIRRPLGAARQQEQLKVSGARALHTPSPLLLLPGLPTPAPSTGPWGPGSSLVATCGHRHSPRPSASRSSEAVAHAWGEGGPARATWSSSRAGMAQGTGSTRLPRLSPSRPPSGCSLASYLSEELGAGCVPLRVAWRSPALTKAWQGAVRSRVAQRCEPRRA